MGVAGEIPIDDFEVVHANRYVFADVGGDIEVIHEFDAYEEHRLRVGDHCGSSQNHSAFCFISLPNGIRFCAVTDFWGNDFDTPVFRITKPVEPTDISATQPAFEELPEVSTSSQHTS